MRVFVSPPYRITAGNPAIPTKLFKGRGRSIICDPAKIDKRGCSGPPDWIIEILSQSTSQIDLTDKYDIYQHAGVKEYWAVHPHEGTVLPYRLNEQGQYEPLRITPFVRGEELPVGVFTGFSIGLSEVFPTWGFRFVKFSKT